MSASGSDELLDGESVFFAEHAEELPGRGVGGFGNLGDAERFREVSKDEIFGSIKGFVLAESRGVVADLEHEIPCECFGESEIGDDVEARLVEAGAVALGVGEVCRDRIAFAAVGGKVKRHGHVVGGVANDGVGAPTAGGENDDTLRLNLKSSAIDGDAIGVSVIDDGPVLGGLEPLKSVVAKLAIASKDMLRGQSESGRKEDFHCTMIVENVAASRMN